MPRTGVAIGFVAGVFTKQIVQRRIVGFPDEAQARRRRRPVEHDEHQEEEKLSFPVQESAVEEPSRCTLRSEDLIFVLQAVQSRD